MIEVVNKKTYKGQGEYIGRPSVLGNPFSHLPPGKASKTVHVATRQEAVDRYLKWLRNKYFMRGPVYEELNRLADKYMAEGHLTLICWCAPEACHGDVVKYAILRIVDAVNKVRMLS